MNSLARSKRTPVGRYDERAAAAVFSLFSLLLPLPPFSFSPCFKSAGSEIERRYSRYGLTTTYTSRAALPQPPMFSVSLNEARFLPNSACLNPRLCRRIFADARRRCVALRLIDSEVTIDVGGFVLVTELRSIKTFKVLYQLYYK